MKANENKLTQMDAALLMAVIAGGAKVGQPYVTTTTALAQKLGMKVGVNSETQLIESLRRLVTAGNSVQHGDMKVMGSILAEVEVLDHGRLKLILNVPTNIAETL